MTGEVTLRHWTALYKERTAQVASAGKDWGLSKVSRKNRRQECKNLTGLKLFVFGDLNYRISFRLRFVRHVFANKAVVWDQIFVTWRFWSQQLILLIMLGQNRRRQSALREGLVALELLLFFLKIYHIAKLNILLGLYVVDLQEVVNDCVVKDKEMAFN